MTRDYLGSEQISSFSSSVEMTDGVSDHVVDTVIGNIWNCKIFDKTELFDKTHTVCLYE